MGNNSIVFRFDDVEVREREFTLIKAGKVLAIEPKAFRALLFLLRNPQRLISKEELLNSLWGDAAVTEGSLTRCIWLLRRLLEDDTREPRYIETVATVGYRFVCPVEVWEDGKNGSEAAHVSAGIADGAIQAKPRSLRRWWLVAAAILVVGLTSLIWYLRRPLPPPRITRYAQITHDGYLKWPVGTDGSRVYLMRGPPPTVAQVAITGGEIVPIPVAVPFLDVVDDVSHDGSNFLVESRENDFPTIPRALWIVRIPGGPLRRLGNSFASAFSPDGRSVAYSTAKDIYLVRSDGTAARTLVSVGGSAWNLAWSPDGGVIRFDRDEKLWQMSLDGSNLHELLAGWHASSGKCCGRWTPDGRFYLFLSSASDSEQGQQIWVLDERRGMFRHPPAAPIQLTTGPIDWSPPIPGRDGKSIFADGATLRGELSRFDTQTKQFQPFLGGISAQFVSFSPDGQSVAYVTFPEGILWKANRDGSSRMQLSDRPIIAFMPRWSPDGTQILFSDIWMGDAPRSEAYIVSARGGAPRRLLPEGTGVQSDPDWSPDGHKIVFGSSLGGQEPKSVIRIFDVDSRQITILPGSAGMTDPRWSPDGRSIAANSFDLLTMNIFSFGTQRWMSLPLKIRMGFPEWSKDSHYISFIHGLHDLDPGVYRMRVKGGELEKVVDLKNWSVEEPWGWMGLDHTGAPLLLRDISSTDIYALTLEQK